MSGRHAGKVAIVTGGGSGYGKGIAIKLKEEGAEVVVIDVSEIAGSETAKELNTTFVKADVASRSAWSDILSATISTHGTIDIIVNNAGICYDPRPSETVQEELYDKIMMVNVKSIYQSVAVVVPWLLEREKKAVFINTASTSAVRPRPELAWYAASKAAVNTANNALAIEYASRGIRFNTVCPVVGWTGMTSNLLSDEGRRIAYASVIPMERMCTPRDVANTVSYLASDEADFITGVNFPVDGGRCV